MLQIIYVCVLYAYRIYTNISNFRYIICRVAPKLKANSELKEFVESVMREFKARKV